MHVYPLQCSCLENPRAGGAWWAAVRGVAQSRTPLKRFSSSSSACVVALDYGLGLRFSNHQWFSQVSYLVLFSVSISSLMKCLLNFFCLFSYWAVCLTVQFEAFFIYLKCKSFIGYMFYKYFLPVSRWPFHFLHSVFETFKLWWIQFINFFVVSILYCIF